MRLKGQKEGKKLRLKLKRSEQGKFKLPQDRPPIVDIIQQSNKDRLENLVPIRHARMSESPFAFYRGTASIMASDLSMQPHTELYVQAIGDCHLMNFGGFATPERTLIFDANDFDETNPAPWEWDVKRLTTSLALAGRNKGYNKDVVLDLAREVVTSYRIGMQEFASMNMLDLWYMKFDLQTIRNQARTREGRQFLDETIQKAQKQTVQKVFYKITQSVLGNFEITDQPPLVYHPLNVDEHRAMIETFINSYAETLQPDRRWLLDQYRIVDVALKVVGVGSVGTRCYIALLMNSKEEPLFLQVKEARQSVLEPYTGASIYPHHGQRIVEGQRLVQAASDIFLGWSTGPEGRQFYLRQLKDKKIAPEIEKMDKVLLKGYARLCGRALARAHAKAGFSPLISGYMGKNEALDEAISRFAIAYADQTERDYEAFVKGIKSGKLEASNELPEQS